MASFSWGSSFEPQLFPKNLFKLAVDLTHPTRQIFDSAREGNIGSMKRLTELREKEGKSVVVVEEIKDSQNRRRGGAYYGKQEMCEFLIKDLNLDVNASAQHGVIVLAIHNIQATWRHMTKTAKWTQWGARVRRG